MPEVFHEVKILRTFNHFFFFFFLGSFFPLDAEFHSETLTPLRSNSFLCILK